MLPFAFPQFEEFYEFALFLEDEMMPRLEDEMTVIPAPKNKLKSVLQKKARTESVSKEKVNENSCPVSLGGQDESEVQLATFHPSFQWAETEINAPINFEKRAPFPTINLLRAARIRAYATESKTSTISSDNERRLEQVLYILKHPSILPFSDLINKSSLCKQVGSEELVREFERIIRIAMD